jgi:hypothetical protein
VLNDVEFLSTLHFNAFDTGYVISSIVAGRKDLRSIAVCGTMHVQAKAACMI